VIINLFDPRWDTEGQPIPEEWLLGRVRLHRNRLLVQSDWAMMPDAPTDKEAWAAYRQALRDFPATWTPSETVDFPEVPNAD
jgi:hypothetical protein